VGTSFANGNYNIQSGQGFFVTTLAANGSITFNENSKVDSSNLSAREVNNQSSLRTTLFRQQDSSALHVDEVLNILDDQYSMGLDLMDAVKINNASENMSIAKSGQLLAIESRPSLQENDTIQLRLNQVRVANYSFYFNPQNIQAGNLIAYLEDSYLQTSQEISLTASTQVNFNIANVAGSYAADRFRIVFRPLAPVPVTFVDVIATPKNKDILVSWKVENELNIQQYVVEGSVDGRNFQSIGLKNAASVNNYEWLDAQVNAGDHFYRIKAIGNNGEMKYSRIVKATISVPSSITIYPNPIKEDRIAHLKFVNMNKGNYSVRVLNISGQLLQKYAITHAGGSTEHTVVLDKKIPHGKYQIEIINVDNVKTIVEILL
jgi:hypothetical protein